MDDHGNVTPEGRRVAIIKVVVWTSRPAAGPLDHRHPRRNRILFSEKRAIGAPYLRATAHNLVTAHRRVRSIACDRLAALLQRLRRRP